ncbi:tyrosine-type recombinase/integrase [Microbacterium endophyticum]|nr:tyrosine-type recombinase/integrase [Microbacterium endophyticum]
MVPQAVGTCCSLSQADESARRNHEPEDASGHLFPGQIEGPLSVTRISELINEALPPGVAAHQLRHRFGTRAHQLGGNDLRAVQKLLGHANVSTHRCMST